MLNVDILQRSKNRLALSFIVKDEGKYAVDMLASVADAVGFVCFADTGSSDNTVEIISSFLNKTSIPFKMTSIPFTNFGAARNAAIDLVPPEFDWVLMLDCDEIILPKDLLELHTTLDDQDYDAWRLPRFNWDKEMWGTHHMYPDFQARLFRNRGDHKIRYVGVVHEQLQGYNNCGYISTDCINNEEFARSLHIHHIKAWRKSPEELSSRQLLYKTLGQLDVLPAPFSTPDPIKFVVANTSDMSFECATIRKVQAMSLADYGLPGRSVYWAEWNHVNEQPRRLADIVAVYARKGWGRLIQPGATCIDIGAHSGDTTIPIGIFSSDFRRNVRGRVYAIEPNPDVFPVLNLNLCLNTHICDFIPINMAVIRERFNEVTIKDHGNGNCNGGIVDDSYGYELRKKLELSARVSYVAKGVNLYTVYKDLLSIYDRRNLSFIKISTAGYEKEILRSSKDLFDLVKPVVFIDWFDWFSDEESVDLFDVIREIGYTPTEIETGGLARPDRKVPELVLFPKSKV